MSREDSKKFYEKGTEFQIGKIEMITNAGTYIDCSFHRFEHGKDLSQISLEQYAQLDALTINATDAAASRQRVRVATPLLPSRVSCADWGINSRKVSMNEIEQNGYNLNISRYVTTAKDEVSISLEEVNVKLTLINESSKINTDKHNEFLKELGLKTI